MEINDRKMEGLIRRIELLQIEVKSIYNEIYTLLPSTQKLDKKKKRQDLDAQMRKNLFKAAKIES